MNSALSAGTSSLGKIELVGQTGTQAPQSMQPLGSTYNWVAASNFSSSFLGWIQSVGQASTQSSSLVQVSVIVYAIIAVLLDLVCLPPSPAAVLAVLPPTSLYKASAQGVGDIRHVAVVSERTTGRRSGTGWGREGWRGVELQLSWYVGTFVP